MRDGECHNVHNLGTGAGSCSKVTFPPLQGLKDKQGRLARCTWAKGCGVTWDGITEAGTRVASGVYWARMTTSLGYNGSTKMVVLK